MDFIERQPNLSAAIALALGIVIGLIFGWGIWPVEWTDAGPQHLAQEDRDKFLLAIAERYSLDGNNADKVRNALAAWPDADAAAAICELRNRSQDPAEQQRLEAIALIESNGQDCLTILSAAPEEADDGGGLGPLLLFALLLLILVGAILFVIQRRRAMLEESEMYAAGTSLPEQSPLSSDESMGAIPLARFQSTYTYGRDTYDDSFSIENVNGDFLGECGVGISESIGTETPKNVTAFEVWLFDKNDIRTVTKVIMSDHAYFDEALKAKLAPKGEPVLASEGEVIVLETASLIINAEIKSMTYGEGTLPPQSFFENFTVELSAWAKEGEFSEPDVQGRIDELGF